MNTSQFARLLRKIPTKILRKPLCRSVSTDSAISRGLRRSVAADRYYDRQKDISKYDYNPEPTNYQNSPPLNPTIRRVAARREGEPEDDYFKPEPGPELSPRLDHEPPQFSYTPAPRRYIPKVNYDAEWIYGTSVVEAALRCKRRELYKLYVYAGDNRTPAARERDRDMKDLARTAGVEIVNEEDIGKMDSMSNSRPHNGYVLECLPIKRTPIIALKDVQEDKNFFTLEMAGHYFDGRPVTEHYYDKIRCRDPKRRFPFVLMLDEISDPGNMGAILRSAYFLGVDAVTITTRNCARLSPVCLKASAGAAELLPIFEHAKSERMITQSTENGWTVYAAIPPPTKNQARRDRYVYASEVTKAVKEGPVVLLVGSEGEGLRPFLKKLAKFCVSLDKGSGTDSLVDSLNVSVATALLCSKFLEV
ncbi:Alpha/beta knot methyltransferase [Tuber borchii]|uniref:rRNA methyltransferase 1, mitochondrial n=1 Tax=Tuber borchii TaxID=42251 RepID=A0A2T6ZHL0_TUBBO|nr:Alpha/beta knot methyltransferase [Tuber borchii]